MRIDVGATVRTFDGEDVGKVERVVVNPESGEVDAVVVHKGTILTRDVVVPMSLVHGTEEGGVVRLRIDRDRLAELPDFVERHYVAPSPRQVPTYPYSPGSILFPLMPTYGTSGLPSVYQPTEEVVRIPPGDVDISEGTEVRTVDGSIGVVDEVRTDPYTNRITSFVVRRGILLTRDVEIPVEFVSEVADDHIQVTLTSRQVGDLPQPTTDRYLTVEGKKPRGKRRSK